MKSISLRVLLVASAGTSVALVGAVPTHGRAVTLLTRDGPDDPSDGGELGPGASAVAESLRAAQANMQGRVDDGVNQYEDLQSENAELWRKNKELQQQAVASDKKAMRIKRGPGGSKTDAERQLEGQISDMRASITSQEAEKETLVQSVHSLMSTNQSDVIARRVDEVERAKARVEARFGKQRAKLQEQIAGVQRRAGDAANIVQELQKQNEQMKTEGRATQQQLEDLQSTASALRSEEDALEKSAQGSTAKAVPSAELTAAAGPLQDPSVGLRANITDLERQLQDAQQSVESLEAELKAPQKALEQKAAQTAAATHLDDGSMEILQSLKEENADLQRTSQSARSDMKGLQGQVESLQFDKDHLVATFASSTRVAESLKEELKKTLADKDRVIAGKDKKLAEQARALQKAIGKTRKLAVRTVAAGSKTGPVGNATSAIKTTNATESVPLTTPEAIARPQPEDPIDGMHKKAVMDRYRRRQMQDLSSSAAAIAGEDGAEVGAADDVPLVELATTTAKPSSIEHFLGVDGDSVAFPDPTEDAPAPSSAAQSAGGDEVDELLRQAQAAVNGETA